MLRGPALACERRKRRGNSRPEGQRPGSSHDEAGYFYEHEIGGARASLDAATGPHIYSYKTRRVPLPHDTRSVGWAAPKFSQFAVVPDCAAVRCIRARAVSMHALLYFTSENCP